MANMAGAGMKTKTQPAAMLGNDRAVTLVNTYRPGSQVHGCFSRAVDLFRVKRQDHKRQPVVDETEQYGSGV